MKHPFWIISLSIILVMALTATAPVQADDPNPPDHVVKLIFIHHSTGENWLRDDYGGLGLALSQNNYFVSDTNYGWGPDSIGDRTDIPNWTEWFRSASTPAYMQAVFNESGQNSSYTRTINDPGGENEIILFKSCFPNSDLGGNPDDPPGTYEELTVSGAKYVYNQILQYFASRPDKLFVIITAPPLRKSDTSAGNAANARAFNEWLVNDWLRENNYPYNNVAVFDFYNVLTGPDNHHRYVNGKIEHVYKPGTNTSNYSSEDSHPSAKGSQKATDEFIPLLNFFYHRWQESAPAQPAASEPPPLGGETQVPIAPPPSGSAQTAGTIDDFENGAPADTSGWEPYWGETFPTRLSCAAVSDVTHNGTSALKLDFDVPSGSWATCILSYGNQQNWSSGEGLSLYLSADRPAMQFDMLLYSGSPENQESYIYYLDTPEESANGWARIEVQWADFVRVEWEADAGTSFAHSEKVWGLGFGFNGYEDKSNTGVIRVDDIQLLSMEAEQTPAEQTEPASEEKGGGGLPCMGSLLLPLALVGLTLLLRRR
jgi:hypothetical protein